MTFLSRVFRFLLPALLASTALGQPLQLTPTVPEDAGVGGFRGSPDSQWIHYTFEPTPGDCHSLYRVHRSGGDPALVHAPGVAQCEITFEGTTEGGQLLVFSVWRADAPPQVWSVPIDGSASDAVLLTSRFTGEENLGDVRVSGQHVLYEVFGDQGGRGLYRGPAAGPSSAFQRLDAEGTNWWSPAPEAGRIVFTDGPALFSAGLDAGSALVRLDQSVGEGVWTFGLSVDESRVFYVAEQDQPDRIDLYSVPIAGPASAAVVLNLPFPSGEVLSESPAHLDPTPDGVQLVFQTRLPVHGGHPERGGIYSVPVAGPASEMVQLEEPQGGILVSDLLISGDGQWVVFESRQGHPDRTDVFRVPITGPASAAEPLNDLGHAVYETRLTLDGATVVYRSDGGDWSGGSGPRELYRVDVGAVSPSPIRISGLPPGQDVDVFWVGDQIGDRWLSTGQIGSGPERELFSVQLSGPPRRTQVRLSPDPNQAGVSSFYPALDGSWAVFVDHPDFPLQGLPMEVPVDGSLPAQPLHTPLPSWFWVITVRVMNDDVSVLYTIAADDITPQGRVLWLQKIPRLFADGFESGDAGAWNGP